MRRSKLCIVAMLASAAVAAAQSGTAAAQSGTAAAQAAPVAASPTAQRVAGNAGQGAATQQDPPQRFTVPAGTRLLMELKSPITTRNAYAGQPVYAQTTFPITAENRILIPAGSYVQGTIDSVKRPGRIKGRAEIQMHFNTLILPDGQTVSLPGQLAGAPSGESEKVNEKEGSIKENGTKGRDAATIGTTAATGAAVGAGVRGLKGLGIGSGIGAAAGVATVLLTRGNDIRFDIGTPLEMTLQRPLLLEDRDQAKVQRVLVPIETNQTLQKPENRRYVPTVPATAVGLPGVYPPR